MVPWVGVLWDPLEPSDMVTCCLLRVGAYAYAQLLGSFGINYTNTSPITFPWRGSHDGLLANALCYLLRMSLSLAHYHGCWVYVLWPWWWSVVLSYASPCVTRLVSPGGGQGFAQSHTNFHWGGSSRCQFPLEGVCRSFRNSLFPLEGVKGRVTGWLLYEWIA